MKIKSVLFLIILFISCQSDLVKKPKNLIDKNKMELIMQDMMLMRSISRNYQSFIKEKNWFGDKYIYEKYSIDSVQLLDSQEYYAKSPKIYLEIHKNIKFNMEKLIDSIDFLYKEEMRKIKENQTKDSI